MYNWLISNSISNYWQLHSPEIHINWQLSLGSICFLAIVAIIPRKAARLSDLWAHQRGLVHETCAFLIAHAICISAVASTAVAAADTCGLWQKLKLSCFLIHKAAMLIQQRNRGGNYVLVIPVNELDLTTENLVQVPALVYELLTLEEVGLVNELDHLNIETWHHHAEPIHQLIQLSHSTFITQQALCLDLGLKVNELPPHLLLLLNKWKYLLALLERTPGNETPIQKLDENFLEVILQL